MNDFKLIKAGTLREAADALENCRGKAVLKAGGTDILGGLKRGIYPDYPQMVVDITGIPDMDYITEDKDMIRIGALTSLSHIALDGRVGEKLVCLAQAAGRTASPHLRTMGTIGGNICQENRCWYYRAKENFFPCKMKGGKRCFAPVGDNRIHSIFGASGGCFAVNPSDTAPALAALDATIVTNRRNIKTEDFWGAFYEKCTVLEKGEIVVEIQIPLAEGAKSAFVKQALRGSIDFPMVNCAVMVSPADVRICLNAVAPVPHRAVAAEQLLKGKVIDEALAEMAGEAAVEGARALSGNSHKIQIARAMVKRMVLECR